MKTYMAPEEIPEKGTTFEIFLAGSIDQGKATPWRHRIAEGLEDIEGRLFNPRRNDWDDTWIQRDGEEPFTSQVEWELDAIERSDVVLLHFEGDMISPITLLEFGLLAGRSGKGIQRKLAVHCPDEYWRSGNIQIVSRYYRIHKVDTLDDLIEYARLESEFKKQFIVP